MKKPLSLLDLLLNITAAIESEKGLLQPCLYEQTGDAHMTDDLYARFTRLAGAKTSHDVYPYELAIALKLFVAALYKERPILPWKALCQLKTDCAMEDYKEIAHLLKNGLTSQDRACLSVLFKHWHRYLVFFTTFIIIRRRN